MPLLGMRRLDAGTPEALRRLALLLYAILGPALLAALLVLGGREHPRSAAAAAGLLGAGALWLVLRRAPRTGDWIFPVAVAPAVCCGIGFVTCGAGGEAFLVVLGAPLAWAAVLFEAPVVAAALGTATATVFAALSLRVGAGPAAAGTLLLFPVAALVAWVVFRSAERLREARREELRAAERDRALLQALPDPLARVDREGRFLSVHGPPEVLPLPADRLPGRTVYQLVPPSVGARVKEALAQVLATGAMRRVEYALPYGGVLRFFEARIARSGPDEAMIIRRDVTEERRAGADQRLLATLMDEMGDAVIGTDRDLRVRLWAGASAAMYGFTAEEAMGQPFLELLRTELLEGTLEALLQRLASGEPARIRVRDARKDGTRVPALVDVTPLRDDSGEPTGFLAVARDMSREMAAEQALRESEERFRSVVSAMAEGVILRGTDGSIAACNASAERILGTTAEEMRGGTFARPGWPMIREDGLPLPAEEHPAIRTLRTGAPVLGAVNGLVRPGGATTWLSVNSEPLRHRPEDPPYAVVTTFTDITEAKRQRDLLERSQRQLALVLEGSNDGFWDLDLAARCYAFSPRCFEIVGERPRGVTDSARFWWGRLHPDDLAMVRNALDRHLRGETERIDAECRLRSAEGGWRWVRGLGMAVERDASGRPTRLAGTLRDNTARHEARDRLGAALRENEKLVAELREALLSVKTLRGLLPICAWCKKVRNDGGYWERIEAYVSKHSEAEFSHALCPECYAREYPGDPLPGPNGEAGGGI